MTSVIDLETVTPADIIRWNTDIAGIQDNVFFVPEPSALVLLLMDLAPALTRRFRKLAGS